MVKLFGVALVLLSQTAFADVINITNAQLAEMKASDITIIDIRRPDEWEKSGTIEGSHPIMFFDKKGRYDVSGWLSKVDAIVDRDQPIAIICEAGVRSSSIADLLEKRLGFTQVHNVTGGMGDWLQEGRPVQAWAPQ